MILSGVTKLNPPLILTLCLLALGCSEAEKAPAIDNGQQIQRTPEIESDNFLWLENVLGEKAMQWVKNENSATDTLLTIDPRYSPTLEKVQKILLDDNGVPIPTLVRDVVSNFWQDSNNPRGLWRETTLESYKTDNPEWNVILDYDKLGKDENKSWANKGYKCLLDSELCLLLLSDGGSDALYVREFNRKTKSFVQENAFTLPEAKSDVAWVDENRVLIATDFGPGSLTESGYPRILKIWQRGTPLSEAKTLLEVSPELMEVAPLSVESEGKKYLFAISRPTFFTTAIYLLDPVTLNAKQINIPLDSSVQGVAKGHLIFNNREDIQVEGLSITKGTVLAKSLTDDSAPLKVLYTPAADEAFSAASFSKDFVVIDYLKNVKSKVKLLSLNNNAQVTEARDLALPGEGTLSTLSTLETSNRLLVTYTDFLTPPQYYLVEGALTEKLKEEKPTFDASKYTFSQKWSTSKDGEKVPYFIVHKKDLQLDSNNPTLIYGYGGFENALTPNYLFSAGQLWLEQGGVYVLANLRGGGEFGPKWHQAGMKENKQKVYDDLYAIAESLISDHVTRPKKLGVMGGSNGGLLVGAALTQRPDLFNAIVCQVPLLDMLRYHTLLAGASWVDEYGNADIPEQYEYIRKYSPYQNIKKDVEYPRSFIWTTTKDDRVHPGHARKMAARLKEQEHDVVYHEVTEGGHGAGADPLQAARTRSFEYVYLYQQLMDDTF